MNCAPSAMTLGGRTIATRRAKPSHEPWVPLPYTQRAVDFLTSNHVAVLPLRPSGRKTSITLAAFCRLKEQGVARRMLVIAPLRPLRKVWRQEGQKWTEFRDLRFSILHGPKKDDRLKDDADVWLINPEGITWLCKKFAGRQLPFDVVAIDELTRFANAQAERAKALRPRIERVPFKWGLTGSLTTKGYMSAFGQMLVLDGGAALGKYITHFRDMYFIVDFDGFTYNLMPGADKRIEARLAPYVFYMDAADYVQLPEVVDTPHFLDMEDKERKLYDTMKKDMLAELPEGTVTGANSAAVYSKLAQMANGAVYLPDGKVAHIHSLKLDDLDELVKELGGEPLLVGYEFRHDLEQIRSRFGKDIPYLGNGTTPKQEDEWIDAWNRNEIPVFPVHPASGGHGLNMHEGGAMHVCWFGIPWDNELYDQFIMRICRGGSTAKQVFNHLLIVRGTIDELKYEAQRDKAITERRFLEGINSILRSEITGEKEPTMTVQKLSRQADSGTGEQRIIPKGWGRPAVVQNVVQAEPQTVGVAITALHSVEEQRERIQATLKGETVEPEGPTAREKALSAFSPAIQAALEDGSGRKAVELVEAVAATLQEAATALPATADVPKATRQRRAPVASVEDVAGNGVTDRWKGTVFGSEGLKMQFRLDVLRLADGNIERANEMWQFLTAA